MDANDLIKENEEVKAIEDVDTSLAAVRIKLDGMSNAELEEIINKVNLVDDNGRLIIYRNEDEAIIYASAFQMAHPDVEFVRISQGYSAAFGKFWFVELPQNPLRENQPSGLNNFGDNVCYPSTEIMMAFIMYQKRIQTGMVEESVKKELN